MREKIARDIENIDRYFPEDIIQEGSKLYSSPQTAERHRRKQFTVSKDSGAKTLTAKGREKIKAYN